MKKLFIALTTVILLFSACEKPDTDTGNITLITEKYDIETADTPLRQYSFKSRYAGSQIIINSTDYNIRLLRSSEEAEEFIGLLGYYDYKGDYRDEELGGFKEFAADVDYSENCLAVDMVYLACGSYNWIFDGVTVSEGALKFDYDIISSGIDTTDTATLFLAAEVPADLVTDIPSVTYDYRHAPVIVSRYNRDITVNGEQIENYSYIFEQNPKTLDSDITNHGSLKIYVHTKFINDHIAPVTNNEETGEYTFDINNNTVTVTKDTLTVENELFGTVTQKRISAFTDYWYGLIIDLSDIGDILGAGWKSHYRPYDEADFMLTEGLSFSEKNLGALYTKDIYDPDYDYFLDSSKGEKKNPDGELIGVNMRGNYIYKLSEPNGNVKYFIASKGLYYFIRVQENSNDFDD